MAVFHQLSEEIELIILLDLLKKMGKEYSERSLRRWMAEMVKEESVQILGRKKATKYQAVQSKAGMRSCFGSLGIRSMNAILLPSWMSSLIPISLM